VSTALEFAEGNTTGLGLSHARGVGTAPPRRGSHGPHNGERLARSLFSRFPWVYAEIVRHLSAVETGPHSLSKVPMPRSARRGVLKRAPGEPAKCLFPPVADQPGVGRATPGRFSSGDRGSLCRDGLEVQWRGQNNPDWELDKCLWPGRRSGSVATAVIHAPLSLRPVASSASWCSKAASIDTNGAGVFADHGGVPVEHSAATQTLESSREQLEQAFHDYLGIDQVLWMKPRHLPATIRMAMWMTSHGFV